MAFILGWKDILRPIRDGYRHLFPTPDTGPTPEERSKKRDEDRLKGFTYFDTFEQLETWTALEVDLLQRSNTPLLRRYVDATKEEQRALVLLCHDYAGNYHDYESVHESRVKEEMYSCEYLQYVDTFVYFSHKLVCVPPPTWTNTLHRNGVKSLGTIIIEPQAKETERLLQGNGEGENMRFRMANVLTSIAKKHEFDGYLVNIEKPFPNNAQIHYLQLFLQQLLHNLRSYGDHYQLVWYDALTTSNKISYQNGLTASNLPFTQACGGILTNYEWDESRARDSKNFASQSGFDANQVYFGIDVWAQNGARTTYPKKGGGGTKTGVAVAKLSELGLSAGVFAPAWSFEHFPGHGRDIEKAIWEGETLPSGIECPCGDAVTRHMPDRGFSIIRHARAFPAGSEMFMATNFTRAFSKVRDDDAHGKSGDARVSTQLGTQSILPLPPPLQHRDKGHRLLHRFEDYHDQAKLIIEAHDDQFAEGTTNSRFDRLLPLYKLNMPADGTLQMQVSCRNLLRTLGAVPSIYLKFSDGRKPQHLAVRYTEDVLTMTATIGEEISDTNPGVRLEELGVHCDDLSQVIVVDVLEISSIVIAPLRYYTHPPACSIGIWGFENRGQGVNSNVRLTWNYWHDNEAMVRGVPFSALTGPFSHFVVKVDNTLIGRAYAIECIVPQSLVERIGDRDVKAEVTGIGFDGRTLAYKSKDVRMEPN